jgi:zinc protease
MFKATKNFPDETFDRLTEDVGGNNNAFTSDDVTAYHETIPANHLQRLIFAEATGWARWSSMRTCSSPSATW